jgi:hypothetical protein
MDGQDYRGEWNRQNCVPVRPAPQPVAVPLAVPPTLSKRWMINRQFADTVRARKHNAPDCRTKLPPVLDPRGDVARSGRAGPDPDRRCRARQNEDEMLI